MWAYKSGSYDDHAHLGADYARKVLGKMDIATSAETDIICDAIWHHDDKANIDSQFAEVLKDADVIDHCLTDPTKEIKEKERARYENLCKEFGLMEEISLFVEENCEADILDETREIR